MSRRATYILDGLDRRGHAQDGDGPFRSLAAARKKARKFCLDSHAAARWMHAVAIRKVVSERVVKTEKVVCTRHRRLARQR